MGYNTNYNLDLRPFDENIIEQLKTSNDSADDALENNGDSKSSCKWYEHDTDLKEFSKLYPDTLFILSGEGEEALDLWKMYVKNGKSKTVKAIISYPPVTPEELTQNGN